ncbi:MAG: hypothetical protein HC890_07180 [Chloroflexaceae bacterium]|nr:hypothetical protein [Chloroflexaceae bacterium]
MLVELMNAEMDYFLERNEFTTNFKELSLKLPAEQKVYIIDLEVIEGTQLSLKATPVDKSFKTYTGAAFGRKSSFLFNSDFM